jgi:transposase
MVEKGTRLKLDKPMMDMLVKTLKAGNYVEVACEATGICKATFYGWTKKGKEARAKMEKGKVLNDNEVLFLNFLNAIKKARAEAQVFHVSRIMKAANDGNWQASAWWLERTDFKRWGRKDRIQHETDKPLEVNANIKSQLINKIEGMATKINKKDEKGKNE